jgi:hypothetical protein
MRYLLTAGVFIAAMAFGLPPASAHYEAPWCAVMNMGSGDVYWDCRYATVEECSPNVLAGNRGFCNHNPAYEPPLAKPKAHGKRHVKRD